MFEDTVLTNITKSNQSKMVTMSYYGLLCFICKLYLCYVDLFHCPFCLGGIPVTQKAKIHFMHLYKCFWDHLYFVNLVTFHPSQTDQLNKHWLQAVTKNNLESSGASKQVFFNKSKNQTRNTTAKHKTNIVQELCESRGGRPGCPS